MLLILSENQDISTSLVINWLIHSGTPFIRIHDTSIINFIDSRFENKRFNWTVEVKERGEKQFKKINSDDISCYWYRRGSINLSSYVPSSDSDKIILTSAFKGYLEFNNKTVVDLIYETLENKKHVGSFKDNFFSKMLALEMAAEVGLRIPKTIISNSKEGVENFKRKHGKIITKGLRSNSINITPSSAISTLTQLVTNTEIELFPENFAPSLFQEAIEKLYELRIFYFNGSCYTAAILSQQDETTQIDFRNYNEKRPNRVVTYQLPKKIEEKVLSFMNKINMQSGSIDMIVSTKLEYYFLEVNPVGQFGWISDSCNFCLEKVIANYFESNHERSN